VDPCLAVAPQSSVATAQQFVTINLEKWSLKLQTDYGFNLRLKGGLSDYGLDDRGSIPTEAEDFSSSLCVQTGSGAHPASCTMGTGDPSPGGKARPGRDSDH
jgi:hypothetical protein